MELVTQNHANRQWQVPAFYKLWKWYTTSYII